MEMSTVVILVPTLLSVRKVIISVYERSLGTYVTDVHRSENERNMTKPLIVGHADLLVVLINRYVTYTVLN